MIPTMDLGRASGPSREWPTNTTDTRGIPVPAVRRVPVVARDGRGGPRLRRAAARGGWRPDQAAPGALRVRISARCVMDATSDVRGVVLPEVRDAPYQDDA